MKIFKNVKNSFTIDNYYDVQFYNETKQALQNNDVEFVEMISSKNDHVWYFLTKELPIAINYDKISSSMVKFLITKVKPLAFNDEYKLYRKGLAKGNDVLQFIENDALEQARKSKYSCFFKVKSRQHLKEISEFYPGKLYFLGKYYNNKLKVCLANHESIEGVIDPDDILLKKGNKNGAGDFESEFNFRVLKGKDYLIKFTESPFMEDGKFNQPKIQSDRVSTAKYILT